MTSPQPITERADGATDAALRWFTALALLLAVVGYGYHGVMAATGHGYPAGTALFDPAARFSDFTIYGGRWSFVERGENPYAMEGYPFVYFPAAAWIWQALGWASPEGTLATFLLEALAAWGALFGLAAWAMPETPHQRRNRALVGLLAVTSFPLLFALDRANVELFGAAVLSAAVAVYARGPARGAAVLFGIAASLKLYPLVFALGFMARRQWDAAALAFGSFAAITAVSLAAMPGGFAVSLQGFLRGLDFFRQRYVMGITPNELAFDHSILALCKATWLPLLSEPALGLVYTAYVPVIGGAFFAYWALRLRHLPMLNQIVAFSVAMVVLPPVSGDYTLLNVYAALALLLLWCAGEGRQASPEAARVAWVLLAAFAVVVTPQSYRIEGFGVGGQIKAVALLTALAACGWEALQAPRAAPQAAA